MNKILITVNALLVIAVGYLFTQIGGGKTSETNSEETKDEVKNLLL